ncbi:MAG: DUF2381 family protein [Myxococcaceae bacterium]|nr:DUF2381 family protein [Myxococcaceae bacterium]
MRLCSPRVFLALCLVTTSSLAWAQPSPCQTAVRQIELGASSAPPSEICISPGLSTTLLFDGKLVAEAVVLEGRERFRQVELAGNLLVLLPSERLSPGERLRLKVRFAEGGDPMSAAFVLVVHRGQAERQVEVSRAHPAANTCQLELQRKQEELQRCVAQGVVSPPSIAGLLAGGLLDSTGVTTPAAAQQDLTLISEDELHVASVRFYRSSRRLALEVEVSNVDTARPWALEGATLRSRPGEVQKLLSVMQTAPLAPGTTAAVWVEIDRPKEDAPKSYTLELWDAGRARTITLQGLRLP